MYEPLADPLVAHRSIQPNLGWTYSRFFSDVGHLPSAHSTKVRADGGSSSRYDNDDAADANAGTREESGSDRAPSTDGANGEFGGVDVVGHDNARCHHETSDHPNEDGGEEGEGDDEDEAARLVADFRAGCAPTYGPGEPRNRDLSVWRKNLMERPLRAPGKQPGDHEHHTASCFEATFINIGGVRATNLTGCTIRAPGRGTTLQIEAGACDTLGRAWIKLSSGEAVPAEQLQEGWSLVEKTEGCAVLAHNAPLPNPSPDWRRTWNGKDFPLVGSSACAEVLSKSTPQTMRIATVLLHSLASRIKCILGRHRYATAPSEATKKKARGSASKGHIPRPSLQCELDYGGADRLLGSVGDQLRVVRMGTLKVHQLFKGT